VLLGSAMAVLPERERERGTVVEGSSIPVSSTQIALSPEPLVTNEPTTRSPLAKARPSLRVAPRRVPRVQPVTPKPVGTK
jgi:hypothetical protein